MKQLLSVLVRSLCTLLLVLPLSLHAESNKDPFEGFNRVLFKFNDTADTYVIKPMARGYSAVMPDPLEKGVYRMFDNLGEIRNVANDLLQAKFAQAANDSGRFLVNTTVGLAGFFEVAEPIGLKPNDGEDFGQTLGYWGIAEGPYLVLPILGPSTLRDGPSRYIDSFLNPVNEVDHIPTRNVIHGTSMLSGRAALLKAEKLVSGDKYTFTREVYLQRRAYLVNDGQLEDSFGSEYDDAYDDDFGD